MGDAALKFLEGVGVGFGATAFGARFAKEIATGCAKKCRGKPLVIQNLARLLVAEPNHRGIAKVLHNIEALAKTHPDFTGMKIDRQMEYWEAAHLGQFEDVGHGYSEITRRRAHGRIEPTRKTLSTVHKAKGLECERVMVIPCDAAHFANKPPHRCLLYVALSRPMRELTRVVPEQEHSPLIAI